MQKRKINLYSYIYIYKTNQNNKEIWKNTVSHKEMYHLFLIFIFIHIYLYVLHYMSFEIVEIILKTNN